MSSEKTHETLEFEGKYLTFNLMDEYYGISVNKIMQIIAIPDITTIPQTPPFVKGVINLRGRIIPVTDLRLRFLLPEQDYDDKTSIIIINFEKEEGEIFIGVIVDKVVEVIDINASEIEMSPTFGVKLDTQYILAMAKVKNKVVTLLDISNILTNQDLKNLRSTDAFV